MNAQPALVQKIQSENRMVDDSFIIEETDLFGVKYNTIKYDAVMAQPEFPEEGKEALKATLSQTGRSTLRVATWLPISMVIGFSLMMLWFKKNGGYKPIILSKVK